MADFQEQFNSRFQEVAVGLINALPDAWTSAELAVMVTTDDDAENEIDLVHTICRLPQRDRFAEAPFELMESVAGLFELCARDQQAWTGLQLRVEADEEGDWGTELEFEHPLEGQPPLLLPDSADDLEINVMCHVPEREFDPNVMSQHFRNLLAHHAALSLEKRNVLSEMLEDSWEWEADLETGILSLGEQLQCNVQLVGSVSESSDTWLWAWANEESDVPEKRTGLSLKLKALGEKHDIWEFTTPKIELERLRRDYLALVVCGLAKADVAYWATYDGGAVLLVGNCPAVREQLSDSTARISSVLPETLNLVGAAADHRELVVNYLKQKSYTGSEAGEPLQFTSPGGDSLTVSFDDQGRLSKLEATASAP